jgi:hypothetical protein
VALVRRGGAVLAVAALLAGCGLGDRQHDADAIIDAADAAFAEGSAAGSLATSMRFVRVPDGADQILGGLGPQAAGGEGESDDANPMAQLQQAQQAAMEREFTVKVALDLDHDRAAVALPNKPDAFAIYSGLVSYGHRWSAGPRDARPWVRVDGTDINEGDEIDPIEDAPAFFAFAINPVLLLDLMAGPLAGSVEDLGTDEVQGVTTTHYAANFDIAKALEHTRRKRFPEDRREAFRDVLDVLAVAGDIHPGEVWLDAEGRPRRFVLNLKEEPIRHFVIEHRITLELGGFGDSGAVAVPSARERVDVRSVVQYLRATIPSPRTPEFLTFLGVDPTKPAEPAP